jgi:hypothetical protein
MPAKRPIVAICAGLLILMASVPTADTHSVAQALNNDAIVPQRGRTMDEVENRFGPPDTRQLPVGDPPITRWIYPDFKVYFEHQYVIHSVAN